MNLLFLGTQTIWKTREASNVGLTKSMGRKTGQIERSCEHVSQHQYPTRKMEAERGGEKKILKRSDEEKKNPGLKWRERLSSDSGHGTARSTRPEFHVERVPKVEPFCSSVVPRPEMIASGDLDVFVTCSNFVGTISQLFFPERVQEGKKTGQAPRLVRRRRLERISNFCP